MARPRMMFTAARSTVGVRRFGTARLYPRSRSRDPNGPVVRAQRSRGAGLGRDWRKKGERHQMPGTLIDATVGENLTIIGELEFCFHQAVGEFAGFHGERADIAGYLLIGVEWPAPKDDFENA